MRYFYEAQLQRMQNFGQELIPFEDVMCQMNDLMEPKTPGACLATSLYFSMFTKFVTDAKHFDTGRFHLCDFLRPRNRERSGVFFDVLFNLGEFLSFEGRDPFLQKQIREEFPNTTLWQRYAHDEYAQLAYEEELREQHGDGEGFDDDPLGPDVMDEDSDGSFGRRQDGDGNFYFYEDEDVDEYDDDDGFR